MAELAGLLEDGGPLLEAPVLLTWKTVVELEEYLGDAAAVFHSTLV